MDLVGPAEARPDTNQRDSIYEMVSNITRSGETIIMSDTAADNNWTTTIRQHPERAVPNRARNF